MRDAMELVASRVDELGKSKITPQPNQGTSTSTTVRPTITTTTAVQPVQSTSTAGQSKLKPRRKKGETAYADWDSRQYKGTQTQRRLDRDQRRLVREAKQKEAQEELARKVKALKPIFDDDEDEQERADAPPAPEPPVKSSTTAKKESAAAKNRQLEMERRKEAKEKRDMERTTDATDDPKPKGKSPARSTKGGKTPKTKQKSDEPTTSREKDDGNKKESDTRPTKGAKVPKQKGKTRDDDATNRKVADKKQKTTAKDTDERDGTTSRKIGPKTMDKTKHVDDAEYELDLKTGKFAQEDTETGPMR